jgi:hypothetical protein
MKIGSGVGGEFGDLQLTTGPVFFIDITNAYA